MLSPTSDAVIRGGNKAKMNKLLSDSQRAMLQAPAPAQKKFRAKQKAIDKAIAARINGESARKRPSVGAQKMVESLPLSMMPPAVQYSHYRRQLPALPHDGISDRNSDKQGRSRAMFDKLDINQNGETHDCAHQWLHLCNLFSLQAFHVCALSLVSCRGLGER